MSGTQTRVGVKMSQRAADALRVIPRKDKKPEMQHRAKPRLHSTRKDAQKSG